MRETKFKTVRVQNSVHGRLKRLQHTAYGEISMDATIAVLIARNADRPILPKVIEERMESGEIPSK